MRFSYHIDKNTALFCHLHFTVFTDQCPRKEISYRLFTIRLQVFTRKVTISWGVLCGRGASVVVPPVDLAFVVALVVLVVGLAVAAPVVRVGAHGREAHSAGHRRALVVPAVRAGHSAETTIPTGIEIHSIRLSFICFQKRLVKGQQLERGHRLDNQIVFVLDLNT